MVGNSYRLYRCCQRRAFTILELVLHDKEGAVVLYDLFRCPYGVHPPVHDDRGFPAGHGLQGCTQARDDPYPPFDGCLSPIMNLVSVLPLHISPLTNTAPGASQGRSPLPRIHTRYVPCHKIVIFVY